MSKKSLNLELCLRRKESKTYLALGTQSHVTPVPSGSWTHGSRPAVRNWPINLWWLLLHYEEKLRAWEAVCKRGVNSPTMRTGGKELKFCTW